MSIDLMARVHNSSNFSYTTTDQKLSSVNFWRQKRQQLRHRTVYDRNLVAGNGFLAPKMRKISMRRSLPARGRSSSLVVNEATL